MANNASICSNQAQLLSMLHSMSSRGMFANTHTFCISALGLRVSTSRKEKEKDKITPFGVISTRSLVIYQAAQREGG